MVVNSDWYLPHQANFNPSFPVTFFRSFGSLMVELVEAIPRDGTQM